MTRIGELTLLRAGAGTRSERERHSGPSNLLAAHQEIAAAFEEIAHLRVALTTPGVIDQAKGILMAQTGCTANGAFSTLRAASMRDNRKLHEVASRIVASVVQPRDRQQP